MKTNCCTALFGVLFSWSCMTLASCGKKSDDSVSQAIGDGAFRISTPACLSTGARPDYTKPEYAVALYDFDALTTLSWELTGGDVKVVYADADCTVTISRRVHSNSRGVFSMTQEKKFIFTPDSCELTVTSKGATQAVSRALAQGFQDSTDSKEDLPFRVDQVGNSYRLTSLGQAPFRDLWASFGCSTPDALSYSLSR